MYPSTEAFKIVEVSVVPEAVVPEALVSDKFLLSGPA